MTALQIFVNICIGHTLAPLELVSFLLPSSLHPGPPMQWGSVLLCWIPPPALPAALQGQWVQYGSDGRLADALRLGRAGLPCVCHPVSPVVLLPYTPGPS